MRTLRLIARGGMPALLVLAGALLAFTACGSSRPSLGARSSPPAVLRCEFHEQPQAPNLNVFQGGISCQVTGAASDETAFELIYSLNNAVCSGPLADGSGSCSASFLLNNSLSSLGTVSGNLLPSHRSLGPVAPLPEP